MSIHTAGLGRHQLRDSFYGNEDAIKIFPLLSLGVHPWHGSPDVGRCLIDFGSSILSSDVQDYLSWGAIVPAGVTGINLTIARCIWSGGVRTLESTVKPRKGLVRTPQGLAFVNGKTL